MISILTPTRGRPEMAKAMLESARSTQTQENEYLFYVDEDDTSEYNLNAPTYRGPKVRLGVVWNFLARMAEGDYLMMGNDDLIFRTPGWDEKINIVMGPDEVMVACFDDGINQGKHFAFPIVTRKWYETMGQFTAEIFTFGYHDTWIFDIAKRLNKAIYIPEILVEHIHPTAGKRPVDETYRNRNWGNDPAIFEGTAPMREDIAKMMRASEGL